MKVANIVYEKDLVNHQQVEYVNYYKNPVNTSIDFSLPTLFVGWKYMKNFAQVAPKLQEANILKHQIVRNELYWEFSFDESKQQHVNGVEEFSEYAPTFHFSSKYDYVNVDPVFYQLKDNVDLYDVLPRKINSYYILRGRMLYVLSDNKIYGLDLEMYRFFNFDIGAIINRLNYRIIKPTIDRVAFNDMDGSLYQKYYKILPNFALLKRYMVVLLTK